MATADTNRAGIQEIPERRGTSVERRRGRRFSLPLVCRVCPDSTQEVEFTGTVINISRSGVLVGLDSAHASGVLTPAGAVRVAIDLPRHPLYSARCMECAATVVRVVASKDQTQVAFEIGQMRIKDQNTKAISALDWLSAPVEGLIQ